MQDDYRKVTVTKLEAGAMVETVLGEEDGLTLKPGKTSRNKKLVVVGVDKVDDLCYGSVLINSAMNPRSSYSDAFLSAQYLLKPENYPDFLTHESFVDCAKVFSFPLSKLLNGSYFGVLNEDDRVGIFEILETTDTLSTKEKKRFGIKRR